MDTVVVTLQNDAGDRRDLELPTRVAVSVLAPVLAEHLGWHRDSASSPEAYVLKFLASGQVVPPQQTLDDAGVVDGEFLVLVKAG